MSLKRSFAVIFGSGVVAQIILFVGMLWLVRAYPPESFGRYGFYAGIASIFAVVAGIRFDYLAFSERARQIRLSEFYFLAIFLLGLMTAAGSALAWFVSTRFSGYPDFHVWVPLFIFSASLFYVGTQHLLVSSSHSLFSRARIGQVVIQLAVASLLYGVLPDDGLSLAFVISQLTVGGVILANAVRLEGAPRFDHLLEVWRRFRGEAFRNTLVTVLQYSTPFAPVLFGAHFYTKGEVGAYFVFSQLFAAPLAVVRRAMLGFLNAEFSQSHRFSALVAAHRRRIAAQGGALLIVSVVALVIVSVNSRWIASVALGDRWEAYSFLLAPLAMYFLLDCVLQPFTTLLPLWGRLRGALFFEFARFLLVYGGGLVCTFLLRMSYGNYILYFVVVMAAVYVAQAVYLWVISERDARENGVGEAGCGDV